MEHRQRRGSAAAVPASPAAVPSATAQRRLKDAVTDRGAAYRTRSEIDFTLVDALLQLGKPESAAQALEEHASVLRAYVADLERVIAHATVEREAESVVAEAARILALDTAVVPAPTRRRRSLAGALAAAALAIGGLLPATVNAVRQGPAVTGASSWEETRAELEAARAMISAPGDASERMAAETRILQDRILALPQSTLDQPGVRQDLQVLLDSEQSRINDLVGVVPEARRLLLELRALRRSLGIAAAAPIPIDELPVAPVVDGVQERLQDEPTAPPAPTAPDPPPAPDAPPAGDAPPPMPQPRPGPNLGS